MRPTLHRAKLLLFYLPETRQQASQAASQQPPPTASGSVVNSVAGVSQSSQSGQSGSSAGSDNLEVFLSFDFVPGFFLCFVCSRINFRILGAVFSFGGQVDGGPRVR